MIDLQIANTSTELILHHDLMHTPVTRESLTYLWTKFEQETALNSPNKYRFQKLAYAAEKAFADRAIILDKNKLLFEQNNERTTRSSIRSTVTGTTKIMTYEDIIEAQGKRDLKDATTTNAKTADRKSQNLALGESRKSQVEKLEHSMREIEALGLEEYCSVLRFWDLVFKDWAGVNKKSKIQGN